jgi:hypothetical protein
VKGESASAYKLEFGYYDSDNNELIQWNGIRVAADPVYMKFDPIANGVGWTDGILPGLGAPGNPIPGYIYKVGLVHIRTFAPFGDVMAKGYMGSDVHDALNYVIEPIKSDYKEVNSWNSAHSHMGFNNVRHVFDVRTLLADIGGGGLFGSWHAGLIKTHIMNNQHARNVNGGGNRENTLEYEQNESSVVVINVGAQGTWSAKNGLGAGVSAGLSTSIETKIPLQHFMGQASVDTSGPASTDAELEWNNLLSLDLHTNDMVAAFDISMVMDKKRLDIYEDEVHVPENVLPTQPSGSATGSPNTQAMNPGNGS